MREDQVKLLNQNKCKTRDQLKLSIAEDARQGAKPVYTCLGWWLYYNSKVSLIPCGKILCDQKDHMLMHTKVREKK